MSKTGSNFFNQFTALTSLFAAIFLIVACSSSPGTSKGTPKQVLNHEQYSIEIYDYDNLEKTFFNSTDDTLKVINFWATWCKPCIEEMPYFEHITQNYPKVKVILVSLDFPKHIESKLIPYLLKNKILSKVVLLDDDDANTWIDRVDENWSGAVPATIIYSKRKRNFYEKSFTKQELVNIVENFN